MENLKITKKEIKGLIKLIKKNRNSQSSLIKYFVGHNVEFSTCQTNVYNEYYKKNLIVFNTQQLEILEKINVENVLNYLNNELENL